VTAGDIEATHDVEIINPEHVIAHLSPGGKIEMQIKVENGRGYIPGISASSRGIQRDRQDHTGRFVLARQACVLFGRIGGASSSALTSTSSSSTSRRMA